jgi:hypothetical protein
MKYCHALANLQTMMILELGRMTENLLLSSVRWQQSWQMWVQFP